MFKLVSKLLTGCFFIIVAALIFHNFAAKWLLTFYLQQSFGASASVENAHVKLLQTQMEFEEVRIQQPKGFSGLEMIEIPYLFIDWNPSGLLQRTIELETLEAIVGHIRVVRNRDSQINLLTIPMLSDFQKKQSQVEPIIKFRAQQLILTVTQVSLSNQATGGVKEIPVKLKRKIYPNIQHASDAAAILFYEAFQRLGLGGFDRYLGMLPEQPSLVNKMKGWLNTQTSKSFSG